MAPETRNVWVLVTRSEELPGTWIAHCLDLDLVSQGPSIHKAFEAATEAILMAVNDDLAEGLNPFEVRKPAPDEDWAELSRLMRDHVPLDAVPIEKRDKICAAAGQIRLFLARPKLDPRRGIDDDLWEMMPKAWQWSGVRVPAGVLKCPRTNLE